MAVYFIRAGTDGPVKIGLATDPLRRLGALQTAHSELLRLIRVLDGGATVEKALHARFAALRMSGEWFGFASEMIANDLGFADLPLPVAKRTQSARYDAPLARVLKAAGGPTKVAVYLGLVPSAVTQWSRAPDRHVHRLAALTGIPAREIRPDLWDACPSNTIPPSTPASKAA